MQPDAQLKVEFDVPYVAGELDDAGERTAGGGVCADDGRRAGRAQPACSADRTALRRSRDDLAYITVNVVDRAGHLVPDAVVPVSLSVSGAAELAAGMGQSEAESFRRTRRTFHGRCLAIVRPTARRKATVRAEAAGLPAASIVVQMK